MKVSLKQLESALNKMKYQMLGYSNEAKDLVIDINVLQEDPGNGVMVECFTLKGTKPVDNGEETSGETRMEIEVYPDSEKLEPRASKIETFRINDKNRF